MIKLVRGELMKITSINIWWLFAIAVFVFTVIMQIIWVNIGSEQIDEARYMFAVPEELSPEEREKWLASRDIKPVLTGVAAQVYTSGQYFGVLFAMLLGTLLVTNEYFHQTATATFLATPKRTKVVVAKLVTAILAAAVFWAFSTIVNGVGGFIFFAAEGYPAQLDQWPVVRAILMNGLAFGMWAVLGVGLGILIRSQIGAVITGSVVYLVGSQVVMMMFGIIYALWIKKDWVLTSMVAWPSMASQIMVSEKPIYPQSPAWWVGGLVLLAYGVLFALVGTAIARKRDIS